MVVAWAWAADRGGRAARRRGAAWVVAAWLGVLVGGLVPPLDARAQEGAPTEAVELYREARGLYQDGRYRDAILRLKAALELDPDSPNLMYNVARVNELLGNLDEAIDYYRRYLHTLGASRRAERADVEATIQRLHGAREEVRAFAASRPQGLKDLASGPVAEPLGRADLAFWLTASAGAALLMGGGVAGWMALQRENEVAEFVGGESADGPFSERQALVDEANKLALGADIMLAAGLGAITTAGLLFFLRGPESGESEQPGPTPGELRFEADLGLRHISLSLSGNL